MGALGDEASEPSFFEEGGGFDKFTSCQSSEDCLRYNVHAWIYFFLASFALVFLRRHIHTRMPLGFWYPYVFYRFLSVVSNYGDLPKLHTYVGGASYALAMFWGHLYFDHQPASRNLLALATYILLLFAVATFTLPSRLGHILMVLVFVPPYLLSVATLLRREAYVWSCGLTAGWVGPPLAYLLIGPDRVWSCLDICDHWVSFPLVFIGQLQECMSPTTSGQVWQQDEAADAKGGCRLIPQTDFESNG